MVLDHVAQQSGLFVVGAAILYTQFFRHGNLHVIDIAPVPERLKDSVGEPEHQQILHRFLAQIVVDAVDLIFFEHAGDGFV